MTLPIIETLEHWTIRPGSMTIGLLNQKPVRSNPDRKHQDTRRGPWDSEKLERELRLTEWTRHVAVCVHVKISLHSHLFLCILNLLIIWKWKFSRSKVSLPSFILIHLSIKWLWDKPHCTKKCFPLRISSVNVTKSAGPSIPSF